MQVQAPQPVRSIIAFFALVFFVAPSPAAAQIIGPFWPIEVTGMIHMDPIATAHLDSMVAINSYTTHRDGVLWYINLADSTGLKLSAQTTGLYAEACVRQGHAGDFASFMPGGRHHLGLHLHSFVKEPFPYAWRELAPGDWDLPDSARAVLVDNIPWVNGIFIQNGVPIAANWFFHGSSSNYTGMDSLWCGRTPTPYPNCFTMAEGQRGQLWIYKGPWFGEPDSDPDTSYVKFSSVGGIIGYDRVHGPEGMVYGTVPYQKRDFLRAYMEWREMTRRGEHSALRQFSWMVHPYQLPPDNVGTDLQLVRDSIMELVDWLNTNWIGQADETGHVMAEYANTAEIRNRYEAWSAAWPAESAALQAGLADGLRPLYLPAIFDRLETCFYVDRDATADPNLVVHRFEDRDSGSTVLAVWSRLGVRSLTPAYGGAYAVLHGDGTTELVAAPLIEVGPEPVLLEPLTTAGTPSSTRVLEAPQVTPNPVRERATIRFRLDRPGHVELTLIDVTGRAVAELVRGFRAAGIHHVALSTGSLRGGVYFLRLEAGGFSESRKIVVAE